MTRRSHDHHLSSGSYLAKLEAERALLKAGLKPTSQLDGLLGLKEPEPPDWNDCVSPAAKAVYTKSVDEIERAFPDLWHRCYPRRYEEPGKAQYDTPKAVARAMMDALLVYHGAYSKGEMPGQTEQQEALWASLMANRQCPTYYLSRDIAVALTQTTPAEVLDCKEIKLPFEAAAFMLPRGVFSHGGYGDVSFVGYARVYGGSQIDCPCPRPGMRHTLDSHADLFTFTIYLRTVNGMFLHWTYDGDLRLVDLKNEEELVELQKKHSHTSQSAPGALQDFDTHDIVAMTRAIKLVFNILLLMTHKPETIEPARMLKRVSAKGSERPVEYWVPHVIGRTYKLRYERHEPTGTHASPRGHWVCGFWREQPHGPARSLRKTLWVEPYWRGGSLE